MSKERIATLVANLREADDFGQFASDMTPCRPVVAQLRELLDYLKPDEGIVPQEPAGSPYDQLEHANIRQYGAASSLDQAALDTRLNEICDEVLMDAPGLGLDMGTAFSKEVAVRFAQHLEEGPALHAQLDAAYAALDAVVEWTQRAGEAGEPLLELLLQHGVHPREFNPSLRVEDLLNDLDAAGLKLRVWLEPLLPLAMRHHVMCYELRPANYPRVETHAEGEKE